MGAEVRSYPLGGAMSGDSMRLSVVIPAFNEEGNIGRLVEETFAVVPETALGEVIVVDDASDDGTGAEIKALIPRYDALRYVRHGRRAGQSARLADGGLGRPFPGGRRHGRGWPERSKRHYQPVRTPRRGR